MKLLKKYNFIRGFCYPLSWFTHDKETINKELGYAKRLNLNSSRIWLVKEKYDENPTYFVNKLVEYVDLAYSYGITTMPVLWNGNGLDTKILEEKNWKEDEQYVKHIVDSLKNKTEAIIMWDIMNEPSCNDYLRGVAPEDRKPRWEQMTKFLWHYCEFVKNIDSVTPITIGHTFVEDVEPTAECVDILSFHDYLETEKIIENTYVEAEKLSDKYKKPIVNSELACLGRANPYHLALSKCEEHNVGWYLFELMIHGYWGDVHGIVYPDGTVRDPAIVAAIFGFYRKKDKSTAILPDPNKEGYVYRAIKKTEEALKQDITLFKNEKSSTDDILEAAEYSANLIEGCELVPMYEPPTTKINHWRKQKEEDRDVKEIRDFAYQLIKVLKEYSQIF